LPFLRFELPPVIFERTTELNKRRYREQLQFFYYVCSVLASGKAFTVHFHIDNRGVICLVFDLASLQLSVNSGSLRINI
jgi:hypothetical protein